MFRFLRDSQAHLVCVREAFLDRMEYTVRRVFVGRQFGPVYVAAEIAGLMALFGVILWQSLKGGAP
ncbi:hypothetical protein HYV71_04580 [Candidatus Uhrbacteria bacterium]|nr:hypothetical protein [Candidatus Uhrbacteria bacterium]